jgi:hypothetical protein
MSINSSFRTLSGNYVDGISVSRNYIQNGLATQQNTLGWSTYSESDSVTFQDTGDTVTLNSHGLSNGTIISFTSITSTTGISINTTYYVVNATTNTFQVASSSGGSALALTTNGSGTMVRSVPKTASGGSANATFATSSTSPLNGVSSFIFTKDAANRQGQGVSYDFTIDSKDQAKVLQISFSYLVNSGTFAAGSSSTNSDVTVWIYSISDTFNATFQTASNSTSYRLIFHVASTSASAYSLKIDNISVSPSTYVYGTPVTDWQNYPLTIGAVTLAPTLGTNTSAARWRRVGDSMEIQYYLAQTVAGSNGTGAYLFPLPSGFSIDTNKVTVTTNATGGSGHIVGHGNVSTTNSNNTNTAVTATVVAYNSTNLSLIAMTGTVGQESQVGSGGFGVGSFSTLNYGFTARVPIQGWSSSVQTSDQTDTRVVTALIQASAANQSLTAGAAISWGGGAIYDTHGAYNGTTTYTVPVSGYYEIKVSEIYLSSNNYLYVYKNGSQLNGTGTIVYFNTAVYGGITSGSIVDKFNAGDTITIVSANATTLNYSATNYRAKWMITRISGPSAIAATETVAAKYSVAVSATVSTTQPIQWSTKQYDTHGAVTTGANWRFTAPISGLYRVSCVAFTSSGAVGVGIYKNGVSTPSRITDVNTAYSLNGSSVISLLAGDYIDVRSYSGSATISTDSQANICIERVGNYA